jgi:hypothetical protein
VDERTLYFHHAYLDDVRERGETYGPSGVSVFLMHVEPDARAEVVASAIDARLASTTHPTRSWIAP